MTVTEEIDKKLEIYKNKFLHLKLIVKKVLENRVELVARNEILDQASQEVNMQHNVRENNNLIKLPKIELPTFSGLYEEWYAFFDDLIGVQFINSFK